MARKVGKWKHNKLDRKGTKDTKRQKCENRGDGRRRKSASVKFARLAENEEGGHPLDFDAPEEENTEESGGSANFGKTRSFNSEKCLCQNMGK